MAEANRIKSGKRFASDLKKIREREGITIEEFHDETKISVALIESFEKSGLFEHPMFNRVYLRSFVRTYADLVGIDTQEALSALEQAMEGDYDGGLVDIDDEEPSSTGEEYEDKRTEEVEGEEDDDDTTASITSEGAAAASATKQASERDEIAGDEEAEASESTVETVNGALSTVSDDESIPEDSDVSGAPPDQGSSRPAPEDLPVEDEDEAEEGWMDASPASSGPAVAAGAGSTEAKPSGSTAKSSSMSDRRRSSRDSSTGMPINVIAGAAVIVILGAIVFFLFRSGNGTDDTVADEPDVAAVDTAEATTDERPPADITFGERMNFTVVAEGGPLQGIRITRDSDLRRPYWIEEGDATVFPAQQRIVIEEGLENLRLLVEGYNYPTDQLDDQGRIVINRETAQAFADTLRGDPYSLAVQPDTNQVPSP